MQETYRQQNRRGEAGRGEGSSWEDGREGGDRDMATRLEVGVVGRRTGEESCHPLDTNHVLNCMGLTEQRGLVGGLGAISGSPVLSGA